MTDFWFGVMVIAAIALVMVALALTASRIRRRGSAGPAIGAAMAAYDEAMHSTAYDAFVETQQQAERTATLESRDDV